jgi:predicted nucleic acid-binding protein
MRIVVDTNIAFSAILNSNSKIGTILLKPKNRLNFYSTFQLNDEIELHKLKILKLSSYAEDDLDRILQLVKQKIRFIDPIFIRKTDLINAENLTKDIDIDDTEFVALTDHIKGFLWGGDKKLQNGLIKKGWKKFVTTEQLYKIISN